MATASPIINVDDHPAVIAAEAALKPLREKTAELVARRAKAWVTAGLRSESTLDAAPAAAVEDVLRARIELQTLPAAITLATAEELPAKRALDAARQQAREELLAEIDRDRARTVKELDTALTKASSINARLAALDERARAIGGNAVAVFAWHELHDENPTQDTRLAAWRRAAAQELPR